MAHVTVNSAVPSWQPGVGLDPNTTWIILPSADSTWTLNGGATHDKFQGSSWMDGAELNIPAKLRLGGLAVLVWHHQPDGTAIPEILTFPPGVSYRSVSVGPQGGSMYFIIADKAGTYGDNQGVCEVDVYNTDPPHIQLMAALCDSYKKLDNEGFKQVALKCAIQVSAGALAGFAKGGGPEGAIIWGGAAAAASSDCAQVVHDVVTATQECINEGHADHTTEEGSGSGEGDGEGDGSGEGGGEGGE